MHLKRISQRVWNALALLACHFTCAQGHHFRLFCWLLVTLLVIEGGPRSKR